MKPHVGQLFCGKYLESIEDILISLASKPEDFEVVISWSNWKFSEKTWNN